MTSEQILAEIREANLSYLMLAQSLIRNDREQALFRLGVSEETAELIGALTLAIHIALSLGAHVIWNHVLVDFLERTGAASTWFAGNLRTAVRLAALVGLAVSGHCDGEEG